MINDDDNCWLTIGGDLVAVECLLSVVVVTLSAGDPGRQEWVSTVWKLVTTTLIAPDTVTYTWIDMESNIDI